MQLFGKLSVAFHILHARLNILLGFGNLALKNVLLIFLIQVATLVDFRLKILEDLLGR